MAYTGTPIIVGTLATVTLGGVEIGLGGTITFSLNQTATAVDLPVFGSAPYKESTIGGDIQAAGSIEYIADEATDVAIPTGTEAALIVTIGTGFIFTAQVVITGSDVNVDTSSAITGTLSFTTSGSYTIDSADV